MKCIKPRVPTRQMGVSGRLAPPTAVERTRGRAWMEKRDFILTRDCGICQMCQRAGRLRLASEVDHKTPLWAGGTDDDRNLWSLCRSCHEEKTSQEAAQRATGIYSPR